MSEIRFDNASYIDPTGRVLYKGEKLYRAFYPEWSEFYEGLLASKELVGLMAEGRVDPDPPEFIPHSMRGGNDGNPKASRVL